jgi:Uma2 family endonuclease
MDRVWDATVDDLSRVPGKAELVDGVLIMMTPGGGTHEFAAGAIHASLFEYARRTKNGIALPDNVGFIVNLPNRRSFSPDAAFWTGGPLTRKFLDGAPIFAVEVRSEEDYGPSAERALAAKRADYFAAGTLVVWDVDLESAVVRVYRSTDPSTAETYGRDGERGQNRRFPAGRCRSTTVSTAIATDLLVRISDCRVVEMRVRHLI